MAVYTLWKKADSNEYHLFQGEWIAGEVNVNCSVPFKSICKKMDNTEGGGQEFGCKSEAEARIACAAKGRAVCGTCVSHLYTTPS